MSRLQRVLILRAAESAADAEVLRGLQKSVAPGILASLAAQARDHLIGADFRSLSGLSCTNMRAVLLPLPPPVNADHGVDRRIL